MKLRAIDATPELVEKLDSPSTKAQYIIYLAYSAATIGAKFGIKGVNLGDVEIWVTIGLLPSYEDFLLGHLA